ncbi:VWA domain-containing protein, partial [Candidatus Saccharibacteria bacterium]|nr:VWA domain-containing protein [Candidatus Saccharibacteria bacterium]
QTFLLGYAEIASGGAIASIPLHPAIRYLTFLSWTQGIFVWGVLALYAIKSKKGEVGKALQIFVILALVASIIYYFGGAWFSAQGLGYGAEYAINSPIFKALTFITNILSDFGAQKVTLIINVVGLGIVLLWWTGIVEKIKSLGNPSEFETTYESKLENLVAKYKIRRDQQMVIVLDKSASMNKDTQLFSDRWIDLIFSKLADMSLILDDDAHVHVYTTKGNKIEKINTLLNPANVDNYIDNFVGRDTAKDVAYAPVINEIYNSYSAELTKEHNPVLVVVVTDGFGKENEKLAEALKKLASIPVFVEFLVLYGDKEPKSVQELQQIKDKLYPNIKNFDFAAIPSYAFTNLGLLENQLLEKYSNYLEYAYNKGILDQK